MFFFGWGVFLFSFFPGGLGGGAPRTRHPEAGPAPRESALRRAWGAGAPEGLDTPLGMEEVEEVTAALLLPLPSRTKWTRLVPPSVLIGHVSSRPQVLPERQLLGRQRHRRRAGAPRVP